MADHNQTDKSGDSDELEALFDSIASSTTSSPEPDSSDMLSEEAMMAAMMGEAAPSTSALAEVDPNSIDPARGDAMFQSIGHLTRQLHDTMRELGFDKSMEKLATELPDARDRLNYVAKMTEQAAERVLNATDSAQPIQNKLAKDASALNANWNTLLTTQMNAQDGGKQLKTLVESTQMFLNRVHTDTEQTNKYLMDIVMAQDFQDLTGQVIKKIISAAADLEVRMVELLVQYTPAEKRDEVDLLHGPQINTEGRTDIAADQQQVDDLLASLGF
ncbi:MAG: protein phosphatase CheZ [Pseudomonadota bacterium]